MIVMAIAIVVLLCGYVRHEYMFRAVEDEVDWLLGRIVESEDSLDEHIWNHHACKSRFNDSFADDDEKD